MTQFADVRVEPMALAFGILSAAVDFDLTPHFELGPAFAWFTSGVSGRTVTAFQYGVTGTYLYSAGELNTPIARSTFGYIPISTALPGRTLNVANYSWDVVAGYRWAWEIGFNIALGMGITYHYTPAASGASSASELQPEVEWSTGWQF